MKSNVNQTKNKYSLGEIITFLLLLFFIVTIAINPAKYSKASYEGIIVWAKILLPSLLPFFIITKLFASSGIIFDISNLFAPISKKLFKCSPITSYIFFMSIISGYPVGSKLVSDLYNEKLISINDAQKSLSFCANCGPMFILGSVGTGMINNFKIGLIIYISHIIGSIINGIVYKNIGQNKNNLKAIQNKQQDIKQHISICKENDFALTKKLIKKISFSDSVMQSVLSALLIGGVVCFCFVLIEIITTNPVFVKFFNIFGDFSRIFTAFFSGILEITRGCFMITSCNLPLNIMTPLLTFIISFGGISTMLQSMAFTNKIISTKRFCLFKFTHAVFSSFICFLLLFVF